MWFGNMLRLNKTKSHGFKLETDTNNIRYYNKVRSNYTGGPDLVTFLICENKTWLLYCILLGYFERAATEVELVIELERKVIREAKQSKDRNNSKK